MMFYCESEEKTHKVNRPIIISLCVIVLICAIYFLKPNNIMEQKASELYKTTLAKTTTEVFSSDDVFVDLAFLDSTPNSTHKVKVYLNVNTDEKNLVSQESYSETIKALSYEIMQDYRINNSLIYNIGVYIPFFTATLDNETLYLLLEDHRIEGIILWSDKQAENFSEIE